MLCFFPCKVVNLSSVSHKQTWSSTLWTPSLQLLIIRISVNRSSVDLTVRTCLGQASKSYLWNLLLWAWSIFHGQHQTVIKALDNKCNNRVDWKWQMRESEEAATEGEEGEDDVPTGLWLTLMAKSKRTCMLFIGKTHACYFRTFITAGASFSTKLCLMFFRRKWKNARLYCL